MDRRNSIKLILAAGIAPAFIAKGLMPVKPQIPTATSMNYAGMDIYGFNEPPSSELTAALFKRMKAELDKPLFWSNYLFIVHPDMKSDLLKRAAKDPRYLAHVKWMDKNVIESEYAPLPNGLLISKSMINNHNGFIKPIWEDQDEV